MTVFMQGMTTYLQDFIPALAISPVAALNFPKYSAFMSDVWSKKTVFVTGASRGLGLGMVEEFLARGLIVAGCARAPSAPISHDNFYYESIDVTDEATLSKFVGSVSEQAGAIDMWINNAGVLDPVRFLRDLTSSDLADHLNINVGGVLNGSRQFVAHRKKHGGHGVLINISSGAATKGYAGWGAYCSGKAAVDRLSECLQLEEGDTGLRVHSVAPGVIDTQMQETIRSLTQEEFPMVEKFHAIRRDNLFNTPKFVAQHLLTLAFSNEEVTHPVVIRLPNESEA